MDAQRTECQRYVATNGGCILKEYQEKETGKDTGVHYANRPLLVKALELCQNLDAVLLVAKVDRLTRDLEDGAHLCKNYSIEFCDHPEMKDPIMQGMYFGIAMQERLYISERIKAALHELKGKGKKLGSPKTKEECRMMARRSAEARRAAAYNHKENKKAWAVIEAMRGSSDSAIARALNESGFKTIRGKNWNGCTVRNLRLIMSCARK